MFFKGFLLFFRLGPKFSTSNVSLGPRPIHTFKGFVNK